MMKIILGLAQLALFFSIGVILTREGLAEDPFWILQIALLLLPGITGAYLLLARFSETEDSYIALWLQVRRARLRKELAALDPSASADPTSGTRKEKTR